MTLRSTFAKIAQHEDLNFLLTNRIPRRMVTRFMGWFSRIEHPLVRSISIRAWQLFCDLDLKEAKAREFRSMHECFVRELKPGARPIDHDPRVLVSPCDAIVGAFGQVSRASAFQAKGLAYSLHDLLHDPTLAERYRDGVFVTLRITAAMYHRFHAPYRARVRRVTYISGDTFNVNPIALARIERLFCRNERAAIPLELDGDGHVVTLVPVAAILVASIRLHFLDVLLHLRYRGPNVMACDATIEKGEELGWFQHGSTILVFAPRGFTFVDQILEGHIIRVGQPLLRLP